MYFMISKITNIELETKSIVIQSNKLRGTALKTFCKNGVYITVICAINEPIIPKMIYLLLKTPTLNKDLVNDLQFSTLKSWNIAKVV